MIIVKNVTEMGAEYSQYSVI